MMEKLQGKTAVVTGAASGIGLALCEAFAAEGMCVVMADVDRARLREAADHITSEADILAVATDVTRYDAVTALADAATERFGAVDVLCNNAGVTVPGRAWELTLDEWRWILDVNLWGVVHGIKAFVPGMVARGVSAHVVNTASVGGLLAYPRLAPYSAAKFGVVGLSESLHNDLLDCGAPVGVSVLCPGPTATGLRANSARMRPGSTERDFDDNGAVRTSAGGVARQVVDAIRHDRFWVLSHPEYRELIDRRHRGLTETDEVVLPSVL
jgi:NAD(P)-dependent dehydrogenase (short-subunit alcohol dehydrogenase family)